MLIGLEKELEIHAIAMTMSSMIGINQYKMMVNIFVEFNLCLDTKLTKLYEIENHCYQNWQLTFLAAKQPAINTDNITKLSCFIMIFVNCLNVFELI